MAIIKTLSDNRGVALIILVIAMTLIAVIGASFVALVSSKHKGFLYQSDSYRAFNIANGGIEYSIRSISDEASTTSGDFFLSPTSAINRSFAGGAFAASYTYASDLLSVSGSYGGSARQLRLANFRRYIDPLTLLYDSSYGSASDRRPYTNSYFEVSSWSWKTLILIPLLNNSGANTVVTQLDIVIPLSGRYLQHIYFYDTVYRQVYDYSLDTSFSSCGTATCKDSSRGIRLASGGSVVSFPFNYPSSPSSYTVNTDVRRWCVLEFDYSSTFVSSTQYQIIFHYTLSGTSRTSTVKFTLS
jgi:hypothetical protein